MGVLYPLVSLVLLLVIWQGAVTIFEIKPFILPSPELVFRLIADRYGLLLHHSFITTYETVAGFLLSALIGIPIAAAVATWRWVERMLYPLLVASQTVPKVAIAPLFIVWLGFGFLPKIIIAFLVAFFPVVISTVVGLKSTPIEMIHLGRIAGFSSWQMFLKDRLSASPPGDLCRTESCHDLGGRGSDCRGICGRERGAGLSSDVCHGADADAVGVCGVGAAGTDWRSVVRLDSVVRAPCHTLARLDQAR